MNGYYSFNIHLRNVDDIEGIFKFCKENNSPSAVSVCDVNKHPNHMYYKDDTFHLRPFVKIIGNY